MSCLLLLGKNGWIVRSFPAYKKACISLEVEVEVEVGSRVLVVGERAQTGGIFCTRCSHTPVLNVPLRACFGISGMNRNEGYWGGGIFIISQNFPKSLSILFNPLDSSVSQTSPKGEYLTPREASTATKGGREAYKGLHSFDPVLSANETDIYLLESQNERSFPYCTMALKFVALHPSDADAGSVASLFSSTPTSSTYNLFVWLVAGW
jgi:hypothetical protein